MAIDEGIINPFTLAVEKEECFEATVINGRAGRAIKHEYNTGLSQLDELLARCTPGSQRHRRLTRTRNKLLKKHENKQKNFNHHVTRVAADIISEAKAGTIVVGDVRGIEHNTRKNEKKKKKTSKDQRRRLSNWNRGQQEQYLAEKTGVTLTLISEAYSSRTCPRCLSLNKARGWVYRCKTCHTTKHRDAVGAVNILMKAVYGEYTKVNKPIKII